MSDIFISYKREEKNLASALAGRLSELGWSIWWDEDIPVGEDYDDFILEELMKSKCVIVLWTEASIKSRNVKDEAREALKNRTYLPVVIGKIEPPLGFRTVQGAVWNGVNEIEENKFNDLIKHIKRFTGEPTKTVSINKDTKTSDHKIPETKKPASNETKTKAKVSEILSVKIGSQVWMKKNLNVYRFRNGDLIPKVKGESEWAKAGDNKQPAWCYYNNDPANGKIYGKIYNWFAVNDKRGLAPDGWHIPSDNEWTVLTDYFGGDSVAGGKMKSTGTQYWNSPNTAATNESDLSGLPGGYRSSFGVFLTIGDGGYWWSSTESFTANAWNRSLDCKEGNVNRYYYDKESGFSVRCLRD